MNAITRVKEAIEEIKKGNMVIMLDDEDSNIGAMYYIWLVCLVCFFTALVYRTRFETKH